MHQVMLSRRPCGLTLPLNPPFPGECNEHSLIILCNDLHGGHVKNPCFSKALTSLQGTEHTAQLSLLTDCLTMGTSRGGGGGGG